MKRKLLFAIIAALMLVPWPVAYGYDNGFEPAYPLVIEECEASHSPHMEIFGGAVGSVEPGDLFFIDSSNSTMDNSFILFLTNTDELVQNFRYMNLVIGVYAETEEGAWEPVAPYSGDKGTLFLTMNTGSAEFNLTGYNRYKITIDRGCFYAYPSRPGVPVALPEFYLTPT